MTFLDRINRIPPFVCRLVACKNNGWRGLSYTELKERSGLPRSTIADLSQRTSWQGVRAEVVSSFSEACGVDLLKPKLVVAMLKKKKPYLFSANTQQRRMYRKLLTMLRAT